MTDLGMNERAWILADQCVARAAELRIGVHTLASGARVIDAGVDVPGGFAAGRALAELCMGGLGHITFAPLTIDREEWPGVHVWTDHPAVGCMASQYAGWQISVGKFFAMGSGPMRAAYGKEELFDNIPGREQSALAVGVLETRKLPDDAVVSFLSERLNLPLLQ